MVLRLCIGNAVKYIQRAKYKGSEVEDLEKAAWYLNYCIEQMKSKEDECPFTPIDDDMEDPLGLDKEFGLEEEQSAFEVQLILERELDDFRALRDKEPNLIKISMDYYTKLFGDYEATKFPPMFADIPVLGVLTYDKGRIELV